MLTLKYRPKSFAEIIGQNAVVSILQRQIATKSWKNVYLFCGSHGCGKTTTARIVASEINNGQGSPIEIDGASNNGVDNIRALIADAQQSSIDCDYKVYIIDEAHQLTRAAWDASLKLIEEPPSNAVFIFCTTNPMKIPDTILSRVQRFDFKRVPKDVIADRLEFILNEEFDGRFERVALERIASKSDGHVRDAIQLLDKCLDVSTDITEELVETTLGLVQMDSIINIINGMADGDMDTCLNEFLKIKQYNTDLVYVFDEILSFAVDCALYCKTKDVFGTCIPKSVVSRLDGRAEKIGLIVDRMIDFKKHLNSSNVETFTKVLFVEMCR